jgi:hypothetical protein
MTSKGKKARARQRAYEKGLAAEASPVTPEPAAEVELPRGEVKKQVAAVAPEATPVNPEQILDAKRALERHNQLLLTKAAELLGLINPADKTTIGLTAQKLASDLIFMSSDGTPRLIYTAGESQNAAWQRVKQAWAAVIEVHIGELILPARPELVKFEGPGKRAEIKFSFPGSQ